MQNIFKANGTFNSNESSIEKNKYMIASSGIRFFARIIDLVILFFFLFFTGIAIFYNNVYEVTGSKISYAEFIPMMFGHNLTSYSTKQLALIFIGWKYCLFTWEVFLVCSFWFIFLPWLLKGRTIGKLICNITTINLTNKNKLFFFYLLKKEFFLWILMSIVLIIYGFVCLGLNTKAYLFNISYLQNANTNGFESFNTVYIFVFLFSIVGLIDIIVIVWMFFSSHKMNLQDQFSSTTVISIKELKEEEKVKLDIKPNSKNEKKNVLPGEVNLKELDKLIKIKKKNKK